MVNDLANVEVNPNGIFSENTKHSLDIKQASTFVNTAHEALRKANHMILPSPASATESMMVNKAHEVSRKQTIRLTPKYYLMHRLRKHNYIL